MVLVDLKLVFLAHFTGNQKPQNLLIAIKTTETYTVQLRGQQKWPFENSLVYWWNRIGSYF